MSDVVKKKLSASKTIEKKARPAASSSTPPTSKAAELLHNTAVAAGEIPDEDDPGLSFDEAEYDVKHPTGDKMRDKVRGLLADSLKKDDEDFASKEDIDKVGYAIEAAMFKKFEGTGSEYRTKYRELSFNFKDAKNGKLRSAVVERDIAPSRIVDMPSKELANDDLKKTRKKVHEKMTRDAMPYQKQKASTDMFKCGKCHQRKCTYYQMQTRSADEPLTTFVTCVNCENRWRF